MKKKLFLYQFLLSTRDGEKPLFFQNEKRSTINKAICN
uniref:Uncharacterized protein n=1 Tax=Rhizophora mucronata TaxID=61149 RepID=A0A2P2NL72_RHIMU